MPAPEQPLPFAGGGCTADAAATDAATDAAAAGTVLYEPFESASDPRISTRGDRPKEMPRRHSNQQAENKAAAKAALGWGG